MWLVFFDIDGTLVREPGTEVRFSKYLLRKGLLGPRQLANYVGALPSLFFREGRHALKKNKLYLRGSSIDTVARHAREWVSTELDSALYPPAVRRLRAHTAAGDRVVLLSGTLDVIAKAIADRLGAHEGIGSVVATDAGRYLGEPLLRHPFGAEKCDIAKLVTREARLSSKRVAAYGNSIDDAALLEWAGRSAVVSPDKDLQALAKSRHWPIIADNAPAEFPAASA